MSSAQQPDGVTLFIDRCAWSAAMGERLKAAGIPYVNHADRFVHDSPDDEWLALPGAEAGRS